MKPSTSLILAFIILFACTDKHTYTIHGSFISESSEDWIYLDKIDFEKGYLSDSAKIENGRFEFSGSIQLPEVYTFRYNTEGSYDELPIFLEPGKFEALIDPTRLGLGSEIKGGTINDEYNAFMVPFKVDMPPKDVWEKAKPEEMIELNVKMFQSQKDYENASFDFIRNHPGSPVSVYLLSNYYSMMPLEEQGEILANFTPEVHHMSLFKSYQAEYDNQLKLSSWTPGLSLDQNGIRNIEIDFKKTTILQTLIDHNPNKVLYIDVWGTWCGPCIASFPKLKELQKEFSDRDIVFVYLCARSLEDKWLEMIKKENLIGQHYLLGNQQLARLNGQVRISGYPTYILVNKEGKVCLKPPEPHSDNIEQILASIL
jgi:thiol-disulfide isomerase/thioredoxin